MEKRPVINNFKKTSVIVDVLSPVRRADEERKHFHKVSLLMFWLIMLKDEASEVHLLSVCFLFFSNI